MKRSIKFLTVLSLLIVTVTTTVKASANHNSVTTSSTFDDTIFKFLFDKAGPGRLKRQADKIREYAEANGYSMEYCFLVDMSIPSGKNRFFVYNLKDDSVEIAGLVAHGKGSDIGSPDALMFSNEPNSNCTSLGKYKMGKACIYFKKLSDLNLDTLEKLSKATIKYINENHECACRE